MTLAAARILTNPWVWVGILIVVLLLAFVKPSKDVPEDEP